MTITFVVVGVVNVIGMMRIDCIFNEVFVCSIC